MTRQEANREILKRLTEVVEGHPDLRFGQILHSLDLVSTLYYEESTTTLNLLDQVDLDED